jgi:filamentous hemagglutinin family protein
MKSAVSQLRTIAILALCAQPLLGGVVLDGSFGRSGAVPSLNNNFAIQAAFGKQVGGNLFQSFSQFNLNSSQSATFMGPSNVHNILARVTSGSPSSIDGTIDSDIQGANLFFMNPAGVLFGRHAQLDVSGSFAVTTASYLNLVGGGRFYANLGGGNVLTSAPVSAFGFINQPPAPVSIVGSNTFDSNNGVIVPGLGLTVAPGKSLSVVAGDIAINRGYIAGEGSRVNLVSVKAPGEVQLDATAINSAVDITQFTALGTINLTNLALIKSAVVIRGGQLTMDNSQIAVAALNPGDGADIKMQASINLANFSSIEVTAFSDFANVTVARISAPTISIAGGSSISSLGSGAMSAGNIDITAQHLELTDGGLIQSSTSGPGAGGSVRVDAATVSITSDLAQSQISADTSGHGAAGNVQLNVTGQLTIAGAADVSSDTFGAGAGGNIIIAAQSAVVDGRALGGLTAISTESQAPKSGPAGNIVLNIRDTLQLLAGGQVGAFTIGKGAGGRIDVNAARVFISGEGAALTGITASTENEIVGGPGGDIQLNLTGSLEIVAGGEISVRTSGPGAGGNVNITAPLVSISGVSTFGIPSSISAAANGGVHGGRGGNIVITADSLEGSDGGEISASTDGSGVGGSIDITARRLVLNNFTISADTTSRDKIALPVTVSQLNVSFDMDHTTDQNLDLALQSPNFTMVDFFHGVGGTGHNFRNTILADEALTSIADGHAPFRGRFHPLNALAAFDTQPFNGTWTLFLTDNNPSDVATLHSWSLRVGSITVPSSNVPVVLPGPAGSANNFSTIDVNLPPAAIVPIKPGNGGNVHIHANTLNMSAGASIAASSTRNGNAGSVLVNANGDITLRGGSSIMTSSVGADAGVIDIASGAAVRLRDQSSITASAGANGGNITISAPDLIYLMDSQITATAGRNGRNGKGGNITIDPQFIVLNNSLISANAAAGQGGNINLVSDFFFNSNSSITATGTTNGTVNISAPELDLGAELITLPISLLSAENQLQERCTALLRGDFSSFISIGRGGTEPAPEELQEEF